MSGERRQTRHQKRRRTSEERIAARQRRALEENGRRAVKDEQWAQTFEGKSAIEVGEELVKKMSADLLHNPSAK